MEFILCAVLCPQISFGGLPVSVKPSSGGRENFVGCMERITYNGDNITNLVRRKKVDTSSFVRQFIHGLCVNKNKIFEFVNSNVISVSGGLKNVLI